MIIERIAALGPWAWWIGGLILLGLEILAPGNVIIWFGIAAIIVGAVALFVDIGWQAELIAFAALALVLVIAGRQFFARKAEAGAEPLLNRRADRLIGQTYMLSEPIIDGQGRVRVDDANWRISGPDMPSGTRVKVTGHDSGVLTVERVE